MTQTLTSARTRLWFELIGLYLVMPAVLVYLLPNSALFPAMWGLVILSLILLRFTPDFVPRDLWAGGWSDWPRAIGLITVCTAAIGIGFVLYLVPGRLFQFPMAEPFLWLMVMLLYPLLSAWPQEVFFRVLYFKRYGALLPQSAHIVLNAALFSYAHLMYGHWLVFLLTFIGGLAFAYNYTRTGNLSFVALLHGLAGNILFTTGIGYLFYHGNLG